jgi:hypothetical protein
MNIKIIPVNDIFEIICKKTTSARLMPVLNYHLIKGLKKIKHRNLNETKQIAGRDLILDAFCYEASDLNTCKSCNILHIDWMRAKWI